MLSVIEPFGAVSKYEQYTAPVPTTGVPALDMEVKGSGAPNYNHIAYIHISRVLLEDALSFIVARPDKVVDRISKKLGKFFAPVTEYRYLDTNRKFIERWEALYDTFFYGVVAYRYQGRKQREVSVAVFGVLAYPGVLVYGLFVALCSRKTFRLDRPFPITVLFIWFQVCYVMVVTNLLMFEENNRFRFDTDPLVLVLLVSIPKSLSIVRKAG